MSVVAIVSMKGGTGKTTLTANLAAALAVRLGPGRTTVVDLDPQNALHWHFGLRAAAGVCTHAPHDGDWRDIIEATHYEVGCLPYGAASGSQQDAFETLLATQPDWLGRQIARAGLADDAVVLIDTPAGASVYLRQACACADLVLVVLLADAGSYATLPAMQAWLGGLRLARPALPSLFVLNQVDARQVLAHDVATVLQQQLGAAIAPGGIHRDDAVAEALALQQPVPIHAPHSQASHDLAHLAALVVETVNR